MKLTGWFPADVKPVRKGWYETHANSLHAGYSYWHGRNWSNQNVTINSGRRDTQGAIQEKMWRGLAEKPE